MSELQAKFKVGDVVQVSSVWDCYNTYSRMANQLGLNNFICGEGQRVPVGKDLTIIKVGQHHFTENAVYGVRDLSTGQEYLTGDKYMKLIETKVDTPQYTLDDLRGKYVRVGTPECEVFLDACEKLGVNWHGGDNPRSYSLSAIDVIAVSKDYSVGIGYSHLDYYVSKGYTPFVIKVCPTQWTIYNNTLPLEELSDEQASQIVNAWLSGLQMEMKGKFDSRWSLKSLSNNVINRETAYRVKSKSEQEVFVDKMLEFYTGNTMEDKVLDMLKEAYDNGCRFV